MSLTASDEQLLGEVYRRLADEPLEPDNPFYQPIYDRPEGEDPAAKLRQRIEWATVESVQLFSGFRGTGKTTELYRLRRELKKQDYVVLYANALKYLSPSEEVDIVTMLMSVAGAFGEQIQEVAGGSPLAESFWQRIQNFLTRSTFEVQEISAKLEAATPAKEVLGEIMAGIDLKAALRTAPTFRRKLQDYLSNRLGELKDHVNAFVEEGVKLVRKAKGDAPIVFLFDQFEQLRGSRSNEQSVIRSVERLFANHLDLLRFPLVHVVYTVPPWLQFTLPGGFSIEIVPCVRLWENDPNRTPYPAGRELLMNAIVRRFGQDAYDRIFGPAGGTGRQLAERLISLSGGHFRDLLRLFRETLVLVSTWRPTLPVAPEVIDRAVVNVRNEYLPIAVQDAHWLREISRRRDTALPDSGPESIGRLSRFLDTHLVLYLTNGRDWYDLHPLIRDEVEVLAEAPPPKT